MTLFMPDAFSQSTDGEIELAGFVLGQTRASVHRELGKPFQQSVQDDGWIFDFHTIKRDTSVYAVFKYRPADTTVIYGIELVGERWDDMHTFRGLKLGSARDKVNAALGKPDRIEKIEDPPVTTQYYNHRNYSVDIDNKGFLYGIQIFGSVLDKKPSHDPSIKPFKQAIVSRNLDSLLMWMTPDVEIHKGGQIITYSRSARGELKQGDSQFTSLLLGDVNSVWAAFTKEFAEGTSESRLHPELNQMLLVDKFFDSNILSEIIFRPHAGRWKVYEIKFR